MKTAIVYASVHHGNTKKLVDAIAEKYEICAIDATNTKSANNTKVTPNANIVISLILSLLLTTNSLGVLELMYIGYTFPEV